MMRDGEAASLVIRPHEGVLLRRGADEDAVVEPLGLDELELSAQVGSREHEDDSPVDVVVFEYALGQHRSIAGAAPDHAVEADIDAAIVVEGVSRVRATRMGADRTLKAAWILGVPEVVVASNVLAKSGVVTVRGKRERCSTLPSPNHLRAEERLVGTVGGPG